MENKNIENFVVQTNTGDFTINSFGFKFSSESKDEVIERANNLIKNNEARIVEEYGEFVLEIKGFGIDY